MKHLSLFSGIGGLDLAAEWAGFETVAFVERDPYCQRVLAKRWPGAPIFSDVRAVAVADADRVESAALGGDAGEVPGVPEGERRPELGADLFGRGGAPITLVSGGFPCQPHSVAGKRQASLDDRDLWPEVARVLREIRPRWFVGENVRGLLHSESGRFFGSILGDLADLGYRVGWGVWGASDVGALHQRERVFIVAYADHGGCSPVLDAGGRTTADGRGESNPLAEGADVADAERQRRRGRYAEREDAEDARQSPGREEPRSWEFEPDVGRVADGVPSRVDRLRALGNAVVPQQAYPLFRAIAEIEMNRVPQEGGRLEP